VKAGRRQSVTIEDVAAAANVSRQTVSRVANNSSDVKEAMRVRVQAVIDELGYVPNMAARRMGGSRSYLILAINDRARTLDNWKAGRGNDWVDQMLHGAMLECEKLGYRMLFELVDTDPDKAEKQLADALASLRPDGVILTTPHNQNPGLAALLTSRNTPFARIGVQGSDDGINVFMDEQRAAQAATRHLIDLGHSRIAFISGSSDYLVSDMRLKGYLQAMAAAQLDVATGWKQSGDFSFASGEAATERLLALSPRPSAIIASNDEMAFAVLHAANRNHIRIPDDLSVISFDDTPGTRFSVPPLTAIRQPTAAMSATASRELINAREKGWERGDHALAFELITRESTAPVR
jgi:LacI family transcriptional regulator